MHVQKKVLCHNSIAGTRKGRFWRKFCFGADFLDDCRFSFAPKKKVLQVPMEEIRSGKPACVQTFCAFNSGRTFWAAVLDAENKVGTEVCAVSVFANGLFIHAKTHGAWLREAASCFATFFGITGLVFGQRCPGCFYVAAHPATFVTLF